MTRTIGVVLVLCIFSLQYFAELAMKFYVRASAKRLTNGNFCHVINKTSRNKRRMAVPKPNTLLYCSLCLHVLFFVNVILELQFVILFILVCIYEQFFKVPLWHSIDLPFSLMHMNVFAVSLYIMEHLPCIYLKMHFSWSCSPAASVLDKHMCMYI